MIRKYHNHKLQTTLWHREEEPLNHHETPGRQIKQSNQLSLPHQDDCNTKMDIEKRTTKHRTITDSHNGSNNKQKVNNNRTTALERTACSCNAHNTTCSRFNVKQLSYVVKTSSNLQTIRMFIDYLVLMSSFCTPNFQFSYSQIDKITYVTS